MDSLHRQLRPLRRALTAQLFWARLVDFSLAGALAWLGWVAVRWAGGAPIWNPGLALALSGLVFTATALWTWWQRPDLAATAAKIDQLAGTRDRLATALAFSSAELPFEKRAARECAEFMAKFDGRPWTRGQLSPRWFALLVPVIVTALLRWIAQPAPLTSEEIEQRARAEERAQALEKLAKQAQESESPVVQKVAEPMKQAAQQIQQARQAEEAEKASLRALSELEAALREAALAARQAEMEALAQALARQPATKPAAQSLRERNLSAAAEQLSNAAKKLDPKTAQQLADAIRKALEQLKRDSPLAQQMSGARPPSEALQKLAQLLRQQAGERTAEASGRGGRTPTEQELLNALENLKNQPRGDARAMASFGGKPANGKNGAPISRRDFSSRSGGVDRDGGQLPSGQPGSKDDTGTTKTPFGSPQKLAAAQQQTQPSGVMGPGESRQSLMPSASGDGAAARRYKALYEAMAPAAEQTVERENIPAGSRVLIKRYFEGIRPPE